MMMKRLSVAEVHTDYGGKINGLIELANLGLQVPDGLILPNSLVKSWWLPVFKELRIRYSFQELTADLFLSSLSDFSLEKDIERQIELFLEENGRCIVRSSALLEDQVETSFAGQYQSIADCQKVADVVEALKCCMASLFEEQALAYWERNTLLEEDLSLAIIIQRQVTADYSGVCFSLAPQAQDDQAFQIEYVDGQGQALVDGKVNPEHLDLPWQAVDFRAQGALGAEQVTKLHQAACRIIAHFGRPMDMEFSFVGQELFLLQARPITALAGSNQSGRWTTANFRDGGVAAQPCPNLMWSLYRNSWQVSLSEFMLATGLVKGEIPPLSQLKFARPYWNLGAVKAAMEQIPGYIERDFDDELGVVKNYKGKGFVSRISLTSLFHIVNVGLRVKKLTKKRRKEAPLLLKELLATYIDLEKKIQNIAVNASLSTWEQLWHQVVEVAYIRAERTYFEQVFINTIQLSMKKTILLKWMPASTFFDVIAHLGGVSHLRPLQALLDLVGFIKADSSLASDWCQLSLADLLALKERDSKRADFRSLQSFQEEFGYHSTRELNLLVPSYSEDIEPVMALVQELLQDEKAYHQLQSSLMDDGRAKRAWINLKETLSPRRYRKVEKMIADLRDLLWWREEFKDISTRYYHLIRQLACKVGQLAFMRGILRKENAIFYLTKEEISDWLEEKTDGFYLQEQSEANQLYCQAYRHFEPPGDLYPQTISPVRDEKGINLVGLSANSGLVTAPVRIVEDLSQISDLQAGEILVTRFTDTGWSYAFGNLAGLITEYGGVLCHASIVARECNLPALVCVKDVTRILKTGMVVTLDAYEGKIIIEA